MDTKVSQSFEITKFELQSDKVIAMVSNRKVETQININRTDFEHYMTGDTDYYEYAEPCFTPDGDANERIATAHVSTFWEDTPQCVREELRGYLARTEGTRMEVEAELKLEESIEEIKALTGLSPKEVCTIRIKICQYGFDRVIAALTTSMERRRNDAITRFKTAQI